MQKMCIEAGRNLEILKSHIRNPSSTLIIVKSDYDASSSSLYILLILKRLHTQHLTLDPISKKKVQN